VTDLSGDGITVTLPTGWEGRVFRRPAPGEVSATAADGPPAPEGATTNTVVHVATIPLPVGVGDFASGAVEKLGSDDALIVLFEYDPASASTPLFAAEGLPRVLSPADFSTSVLQRSIRGQAGAQMFFHDGGRAFCLYVVLGSFQNRVPMVDAVNQVLATFAIEGGSAATAVTNTVVDAIAARPDLSTFSALLAGSELGGLLAQEPAVTVLAPIDAAFDDAELEALRADPDLLARTLMQHVVRERLAPDALRASVTLTTLAGGTLEVVDGGTTLTIDGFDVVPTPIDASNGVVYAIRGVLEPPP
jgi:uncharacterized surface protein with fasciclin (FAS1) repeats